MDQKEIADRLRVVWLMGLTRMQTDDPGYRELLFQRMDIDMRQLFLLIPECYQPMNYMLQAIWAKMIDRPEHIGAAFYPLLGAILGGSSDGRIMGEIHVDLLDTFREEYLERVDVPSPGAKKPHLQLVANNDLQKR